MTTNFSDTLCDKVEQVERFHLLYGVAIPLVKTSTSCCYDSTHVASCRWNRRNDNAYWLSSFCRVAGFYGTLKVQNVKLLNNHKVTQLDMSSCK